MTIHKELPQPIRPPFIPGADAVLREISHDPDNVEDLGYLGGLSESGRPLVTVEDHLSGSKEQDKTGKISSEMRIERQPIPEIKTVEVLPEDVAKRALAAARMRLRKSSPTADLAKDYIKAQRDKRHGTSSK